MPAELAAEAGAAVSAGAQDIHLHPKNADGVDTLAPETVAAVITAVRDALVRAAIKLIGHTGE